MNDYQPYSCLFKKEAEPAELKSCFIVWVPLGRKLTGPRQNTVDETTTISYTVVSDSSQIIARQEEYENIIAWDGEVHFVNIILKDSNGIELGNKIDSTNNVE
ncbi:MAG: hypothetical protein K9G76_10225 [Bacteroidales bacterium]|nr:hypothetical protein [Bacteroidales bacterium]MCF8404077.1 hypothetical protein [Bacteroidales bacterium]